MIFSESQHASLKRFIQQRLSVSSETDPEMLADYVIVLLRHDKPPQDLEMDCRNELEFFLKQDTGKFVDDIFRELGKMISPAPAPVTRSSSPRGRSRSPGRQAPFRDDREPPVRQSAQDFASVSAASSGGGGNWGSDRAGADWSAPNPIQPSDLHLGQQRESYREDSRYESHRDRRNDGDGAGARSHDSWRSGSGGGGGRRRGGDSRRDDGDDDGEYRRGRRFEGRRNNPMGDRLSRGNRDDRRPQYPSEPSTKLQVFNIPQEHCDEAKLREYFSQFGSFVSFILYPLEGRAVIEYENVKESYAAHSHPEAPFNNRFIKIHWLHDRGPRATANVPAGGGLPEKKVELSPEERQRRLEDMAVQKEKLTAQMADLARQQEIQRQELLAKLGSVSQEDRDQILQGLKNVTQTIVGAKESKTLAMIKTPAALNSMTLDSAPAVDPSVFAAVQQAGQDTNGMSNEDLQQKLEALKREHAALGLSATAAPFVPRGGYRGRARGRGRGAYSAGDQNARSFKLDLRPRQLQYTGFPESIKPLLRPHLEQFGTIENYVLSPGGEVAYVKYSKRWEAEQALQRGGLIEDPGTGTHVSMNIDWSTETMPEAFLKHENNQDFTMDLEDE